MNLSEKRKSLFLSREVMALISGFICLGIIALIWGLIYETKRTWALLLLNSHYFLTLSVSAVFFLAVQYVSGARWAEVLRRVPEAISGVIPYCVAPMLLLYFGFHSLYHWSEPGVLEHDPILAAKSIYLNTPFFFIRMVIIIALWSFFAMQFRKNSLREDVGGGKKFYEKNVRLSAIFIVVFAITFSIASFDWIMSLEPHWYSTIFAIYNFSGMFVHGIAIIALIAIILCERGVLPELREDHIHDLGKLVFAFTFFWAYIWYSQFVLIWYGNIPEETVYYFHRLQGDWNWLFYTNFIINFLVPFFILLPRQVKRNGAMVKRVCILLLVGRWLDLYLLIAPGVLHDHAFIGVLEFLVSIGFAGIFFLLVRRKLSGASIVPQNSPYLKDSLSYHQ